MFFGTATSDVYRNRFRMKRFTHFLTIVDEIIARSGGCRILDVGGRMDHWDAMVDQWGERKINVTLANLDLDPVVDPRFASIAADACDLSRFADNAFDIVYSNSVIEHVGNWPRQKRMAEEIRRVAPRHFVQTPNYWFPIEPHFRLPFIHWLPLPWRVAIICARACGFYPRARNVDEARTILDDAHLLDRPAMAQIFPDSVIARERVVLVKSLIAIR